jgi:hypothetical protein
LLISSNFCLTSFCPCRMRSWPSLISAMSALILLILLVSLLSLSFLFCGQ